MACWKSKATRWKFSSEASTKLVPWEKNNTKQWKRNTVQIFPQKVNLLPQRTAYFLLAIIFNLSQIYFYYNLNVSAICHNIIIMGDTKIAKYSRHLIPFYRTGNYSQQWLDCCSLQQPPTLVTPPFSLISYGFSVELLPKLLNWLEKRRGAARVKKELKLIQFIRMKFWFLLPGYGHSFGLRAHRWSCWSHQLNLLIPETTWDTLESENSLDWKGPLKVI